MRIAVFASGTGSNFEALAEAHQVACLVCDRPDAAVIAKAERRDVKVLLVPAQEGESREGHEARIASLLEKENFQLICLAGWRRLLSASFLQRFPAGSVVNIHPSLLPAHPGLGSYRKAWDAGDAVSGITVHVVDEGMDTGPVLAQEKFARQESDDFAAFQTRGLAVEHALYPRVVGEMGEKAQIYRVEVFPREKDLLENPRVLTSRVYWIRSQGPRAQLARLAREVLADPVAETAFIHAGVELDRHLASLGFAGCHATESGFLPGVTDNAGAAATEALNLHACGAGLVARSGTVWRSRSAVTLEGEINPLLHWREDYGNADATARFQRPRWDAPVDTARPVRTIDLDVSDDDLLKLNDENWWALTIDELRLARDFFRSQKRAPTDVEMEVVAQTWSEHCKHKIFRAIIDYSDKSTGERREVASVFKTYVKGLTDEVRKRRNLDWLVSVFDDNAGVVRWDPNIDLAIKVETHNSPSALDPYGGALTGILGVNRDILGVGMGARPIANTDVFCLGPEGLKEKMGAKWPAGVKAPETIRQGVHRGVKDGGNKSGIPTVNGAFHYDVCYAGKPLVYCGTLGAMPRTVNGKPSSEKPVRPGDHVVMVGGKIGKDGLHGATFSSLEWKEGTPASVVQIGDPMTQKRVTDFILDARDKGLYSGLTDNGAGGLSSSVGEMAQFTGGARIDLALAPVKYPGLAPWELMVSESQERMTVAVPPEVLQNFLKLAADYGVDATSLGEFTNDGVLRVSYAQQEVAALPLSFLHEGLPAMRLTAEWDPAQKWEDWCEQPWPRRPLPERVEAEPLREALLAMLASPNVRSHEAWVRQYDHEVQAATVRKPFSPHGIVADAGVVALAPHGGAENTGVSVSCGLAPQVSRHDARTMAAWAVDEAVRNAICSGADPERMAMVDNFCWPDPVTSAKNPDGAQKLAHLVRAAEGMAESCLAHGLPLVSGKDSMKNDAHLKTADGTPLKISALPTLLMSCIAHVPDLKRVPSSAPTEAGLVLAVLDAGAKPWAGTFGDFYKVAEPGVPAETDLAVAPGLYRAFHQQILQGRIHSAHDASEGGLLVAAAETSYGTVGMKWTDKNSWLELFGEAPGRILFTCSLIDWELVKTALGKHVRQVGRTVVNPGLTVATVEGPVAWTPAELRRAHRGQA